MGGAKRNPGSQTLTPKPREGRRKTNARFWRRTRLPQSSETSPETTQVNSIGVNAQPAR